MILPLCLFFSVKLRFLFVFLKSRPTEKCLRRAGLIALPLPYAQKFNKPQKPLKSTLAQI